MASQERRCRDYAAMKGYEVVDVFRDDVSGGHASRPAMMAMIKFLKAHRKEGYICIIDDISRFSRDIRGHWDLRDLLREAGGKLEKPHYRVRGRFRLHPRGKPAGFRITAPEAEKRGADPQPHEGAFAERLLAVQESNRI